MSRIFAISAIAAGVTVPYSRCAKYINGNTADRFLFAGYLARIDLISDVYFSASTG
jgi:hypothetical protein